MNRPVVLIGAPGSGKTTVGQLLAASLGLDFIDIDALIEQQAGKPISEIFADDGEPAFRQMEVATTIAHLDQPAVISLGGGAVMSAAIQDALAGHQVVWLEVAAATAINRAGLNTARPLLLGNVRGTLIKLLAERTPVYQRLATWTVSNDGSDAQVAVAEITQLLTSQSRA